MPHPRAIASISPKPTTQRPSMNSSVPPAPPPNSRGRPASGSLRGTECSGSDPHSVTATYRTSTGAWHTESSQSTPAYAPGAWKFLQDAAAVGNPRPWNTPSWTAPAWKPSVTSGNKYNWLINKINGQTIPLIESLVLQGLGLCRNAKKAQLIKFIIDCTKRSCW